MSPVTPVIYIIGTLLILFQVPSRGATIQQGESAIRIYMYNGTTIEISNATTIDVTDTDSLLLLTFVGDTSIHDMDGENFNMNTSYQHVIKQRPDPDTERITDSHLLKVTGSGKMTVIGVREADGTVNDYKIVLYFDVQSNPTEPPTSITTTMTTTEEDPTTTQVTLTGGEITTSDEVPTLLPAASIQIEQGTFVSVVVVAVVIAVVLCLVIVVAVAMAIYYRKRLKDSQQERVNDSTREMA